MEMTQVQSDLLNGLRLAVGSDSNRRFDYVVEWLGYLPFGLYHWIEIEDRHVSNALPSNWEVTDLKALETLGYLVRINEWNDPQDEYHAKVTFELRRTEELRA